MTTIADDLSSVMNLGEARAVPANEKLVLRDPNLGYLVTSGEVEVFATELRDGVVEGPMHPVRSVKVGELFFGGAHPDVLLSAVGTAPGTEVRPCSFAELARAAQEGADAVLDAIDRSIASIGGGVVELDASRVGFDPSITTLVPNMTTTVTPGSIIVTLSDGMWIDGTMIELAGRAVQGVVPLPPGWQATATMSGEILPLDTRAALRRPEGIIGLRSFISAALELLVERIKQSEEADAERLEFLERFETEVRASTYAELGSVLTEHTELTATSVGRDDFLAACRVVTNAAGITLVDPPRSAFLATEDPIEVVARYARLRTRTVLLTRGWWRNDSGPLLAKMEDSGAWVALVPRNSRSYELVRPDTGERKVVDADLATAIGFEAIQFYRPLPRTAVSGRDVLRYLLHDVRLDLWRMLAMGVAVGLLSLLPTVVAEVLFNTVVPAGERGRLGWLIGLLVGAAAATGMLGLAQALSALRVETRGSYGLQAAVFDRLLELPTPFFRDYSAGDLAFRTMGIENLRELLSQYTVTTVLALFAAFANLILMFVIQPLLGVFGLLVIVVGLAFMHVAFRQMAKRQLVMQDLMGKLFGFGVQIVGAVPKLRVADAEGRAFALWAERFAAVKRASMSAMRSGAMVTAFFAAFVPLASALVLVGAALQRAGSLSPGTFLAFNTSLVQVVAAFVAVSVTIVILAACVPFYQRLQPILSVPIDSGPEKSDPGVLRGAIDVSHVSFRYYADGPLVLDDVSFSVAPGEMVAIVGPSGSGKSSLLRLLLDFEQPELGTITYDEKDLAGLDSRAVRRQCGVVIQGTRLSPDNIYQNIVGTRKLTMDDAWEALHIVGMDAYVKSLAMGMHTVVNEQGGAFSGGQRQLLLLARALVGHPRVVILDEATSALDNQSQAAVMASIESMRATRIIIAHRLSTIRSADRIIVVVAGRIVQDGTYEELTAVAGPFADLVRRQSL